MFIRSCSAVICNRSLLNIVRGECTVQAYSVAHIRRQFCFLELILVQIEVDKVFDDIFDKMFDDVFDNVLGEVFDEAFDEMFFCA